MAETHKREFPFTGHTTDVEAEVATLDNVAKHLNREVPDIVKMAVQGFEYKACGYHIAVPWSRCTHEAMAEFWCKTQSSCAKHVIQ